MFRMAIAMVYCALPATAMAQMSPVGLWKAISDTDGIATSEVRIIDVAGVLTGKIERVLDSRFGPDDRCTRCEDDRKNQPIVGMQIIRAAKKADGKNVWESGNILAPRTGTVYKLRMTPIEDGKRLELRGFAGFALLGRTQIWDRVE